MAASTAVVSNDAAFSSFCREIISDPEWEVVAPYFETRSIRGRPTTWPIRMLYTAVVYAVTEGIRWRMLPPGFPPWETVYGWFRRRIVDGAFVEANAALVRHDRIMSGRAAEPTRAALDAQSVRSSPTAGSRGVDGGKKVKGQKRSIAVDGGGRLLFATLCPANVHDGVAALSLLRRLQGVWPDLRQVLADSAYRGVRVAEAATPMKVEVTQKPDGARGFVVIAGRWVVERTFAWLCNCRRLVRCYERRDDVAVAFMFIASIRLLSRRIARRKTQADG